jgi:SAM-dependent methyltransferase
MSASDTSEERPKAVKSPITGSLCARSVKCYPAAQIVEKFRLTFDYDVSSLFQGVRDLKLFVCPDTGYQFFFPRVEGNGDFYAHLQSRPTYYMDWKWEHAEALGYIQDGDAVLEVGSGAGGFLAGLGERRRVRACGLELNPSGIAAAKARGVQVVGEPVQRHAESHAGAYDVVCSYQVLEHVYDVRDFLGASVACLKPGGRLIVSVPDNDSFVGALDPVSDCPPHHVGRYTAASLEKVGQVFGLKKLAVAREPLQSYHYSAVETLLVRRLFGENRYVRKLCVWLGGMRLIRKVMATCGPWMNGHTLFMVFVKA